MKFVMDAGHGYSTPGKRTPDGMREYEFNRVVANYARTELLKYEKVEVLFTHSDDRDVPLKERTDKANAWGGEVLVSIHANAFGNGGWNTARGIETYSWNGQSPNGDALAKAVQNELVKATGLFNRGHKTADFHMLREFAKASCLVECGFMTNKEEAVLLKSDAYRRQCAIAIVDALVSLYGLKKKPVSKPKGKLYKVQVGAFSEKQNADKLAAELKGKGYSTYIVQE